SKLPLCLCGKTIAIASFSFVQLANELLDISPRNIFYWKVWISRGMARIGAHHSSPLRLRDFILSEVKSLTERNLMFGLLGRLACDPHREFRRRKQQELHSYRIAHAWL